MEEEIKIVVLGDPGVGKTSLVLNIVTENFNQNPPKCLNRIGITNEIFATNNYGMTYLIDYDDDNAERILKDADAVCLCHSIEETHEPEKLFESCERWLSFVRLQAYKSPPVILVGTKSDKVNKNHSWKKKCKDLMSRYPEVASSIECSAKLNIGILNVFVSAQKCAIHPICPVFNARTGKLTAEASTAIKRIFSIADHDFNNVIGKSELCELQRLVFGSPLNDQAYDDIKKLIVQTHHRGFTKRGMERDGFISLQAKLCSNLKQEVVWKMLKAFGYELKNGEIKLKDLMKNSNYATSKFVFTSNVIDFLTRIFIKCDFEERGGLTQGAMETLFQAAGYFPDEFDIAYNVSATTTDKSSGDQVQYISLSSYLVRWHIMLVKNLGKCVELIFLLGFFQSQNGLTMNTTKVSNPKLIDHMVRYEPDVLKRNYFHAVVTGNKYIGKTTLLHALIPCRMGSTLNWTGRRIPLQSLACQKILILEERSLSDVQNMNCDCILTCYSLSDAESLDELKKYVKIIRETSNVPFFLVKTRCDLNIRNSLITDAQIKAFSKEWCTINQELNFHGFLTPHEFYRYFTKTMLISFGMSEPNVLKRYMLKYNISIPMATIGFATTLLLGLLLLRHRK